MVCIEVEEKYWVEISISTTIAPYGHPNCPNGQRGAKLWSRNLAIEITAKQWQKEQNFILRDIGMMWVGF